MATGGLAVIRDNLFYIGAAKQAAWNTPITTPTWYHRWLQGTDIMDSVQYGSEREGDTSPVISLVWKTGQYWAFKIVEYARPQGLGYVLEALLGTGSDTFTAPTKASTVGAAGILAGGTTFPSVVDLGNVGSVALNFDPGLSNPLYEIQTVDLTTRTGAGTPWTYTLAAGATFKKAHAAASTINSVSKHLLTNQPTTFDPCTYEFGYGLATTTTKGAFRATDAVCVEVDIVGQKGQLWRIEHTWIAATGKLLTALQTPTYEGASQVGIAGSPFVWWQGSQWNINGSGANNAATIESFQIRMRKNVNWDDLQSEALTPVYFLPGNFDVDGSMTVQFQSFQQYYDMYFGSPSAANNTTDSTLVGFEALDLICTADAINSFEINVPVIYYTAGKLSPSLDGKPLKQPLSFTARKPSPGATIPDILQLTVNNSLASQY